MEVLKFLAIAAISFVFDIVYAGYIYHVSKKHLNKATLFSGLVMLVSASLTISYVEDKWNLVPVVLGGMIGTYVSTKYLNKD